MKFLRFKQGNFISQGILKGETIQPIEGNIFDQFRITEKSINLQDVELLNPLNPGKIIVVGLNYSDHVGELNFAAKLPDEPITFLVSNTAVIGPNGTIKLNSYEHRVDHECELVAVIGKECTNVTEEEALDYVFGFTCGNDVSDRDLQNKDGQWTRGKSFPTFKPIGPWIETDLDPNNLKIQTFVNGEIRQDSTTKHMIFPTAKLVSFLSGFMTLYPGDIIMTGTPEGVSPIKKGDTVEVKIEGIGTLTNFVE